MKIASYSIQNGLFTLKLYKTPKNSNTKSPISRAETATIIFTTLVKIEHRC